MSDISDVANVVTGADLKRREKNSKSSDVLYKINMCVSVSV